MMTLMKYSFFLATLYILYLDINKAEASASRFLKKQKFSHKYYYDIHPSVSEDENVNIQLYYECLCSGCREFDTTQFRQVVKQLSSYLNIQTYPYGNAQTIDHDGTYEFECQHGPAECYGNKLHACALNIVQNQTEAVLYNSCMMDPSQDNDGSDDAAADKCGASMSIDAAPIKACAKGDQGTQLLKYYGDESKKANFQYVPYVLVNGKESDGNFMKDVCAAFTNPPPPCVTAPTQDLL